LKSDRKEVRKPAQTDERAGIAGKNCIKKTTGGGG